MLSGKTILDLTWVLGGPFASQLLAQLGAEVIKIEPPAGDHARVFPPFTDAGESAFYMSVNRGKKSVCLDLKSPEGMETFRRLVEKSDAVMHGFAPNVPKKLGIDFDTLRAVNDKIVVAQLIGLHDGEEYANAPAFDMVVQALAGFMSITGSEGGAPVRAGYQVADLVGGLYLALATVSALLKAETTQTAQYTQVSLFDAQIGMLTWQAQNFLSFGTVPKALGARHAVIAPSDAYEASDGRYIVVTPTGHEFWLKFCTVIGREDLPQDPRFATVPARTENVVALTEAVSSAMATRPAVEWEALFTAARVPSAVVRNVEEALDHPIVRARNMVETVTHRDGARTGRFLGNPIKFADSRPLAYPPNAGEDTYTVLAERLGLGREDLEKLEASGAIGPARSGGRA